MTIIIEGPDGAGKSTLVENITKISDYNIIKMTAKGNQSLDNYIQKLFCDNVLIDRCWISEQIYYKYFKRKQRISDNECNILNNICKKRNIPIIFIIPSLKTLKERLKIRGDEFEDIICSNIEDIRNDYIEYAKNNDCILVYEDNDSQTIFKEVLNG